MDKAGWEKIYQRRRDKKRAAEAARDAFGAERGWKYESRLIDVTDLCEGRIRRRTSTPPMNNIEGFTLNGVPVALVTHSYPTRTTLDPDPVKTLYEALEYIAEMWGLRFERLPRSWYDPVNCCAGVYTKFAPEDDPLVQ